MIDHCREGCRQGVGMVLEQTRFGGFFIACENVRTRVFSRMSGAPPDWLPTRLWSQFIRENAHV